MQFSRYMVSITIFIISLYRRASKDASGLGFMSSSDIRGQQDLFQVAGNGRVSGFGKGGGNLIPVHLERGGISWHSAPSQSGMLAYGSSLSYLIVDVLSLCQRINCGAFVQKHAQ